MFVVNGVAYQNFIQAYEACYDGDFIYTPQETLIKPNYTMLNNMIKKLKTMPRFSEKRLILQFKIKELMNNFLEWENINFRKYAK